MYKYSHSSKKIKRSSKINSISSQKLSFFLLLNPIVLNDKTGVNLYSKAYHNNSICRNRINFLVDKKIGFEKKAKKKC